MRASRILAVCLLLALAVLAVPGLRLRAWVLLGRSPECPAPEALKADENARFQIDLKDQILARSRLIERDPAGYHLWETPWGRFWMPRGSDFVLHFNLAEQERRIYGGPDRGVRPGDTVLDCGANVGVYTRAALNDGARLVVAIEPAPENVECLRRNFAPETAAGSVILCPKGVWDKDDVLTLKVDPVNSAADSFLIDRPGALPVHQVPLTSIDKLVEELRLDRVDVIKMDIEGAEPKALEGARRTLQRFRPRLALSVYHAPDHPRTIPQIVRAAWPGYRVECGSCSEAAAFIRPDVYFFH